ncbi:hypothetical protein Gpo141_00007965 [Globisporangium polare]
MLGRFSNASSEDSYYSDEDDDDDDDDGEDDDEDDPDSSTLGPQSIGDALPPARVSMVLPTTSDNHVMFDETDSESPSGGDDADKDDVFEDAIEMPKSSSGPPKSAAFSEGGYTTAYETAPSSSASTHVSDESSPSSTIGFVHTTSATHRFSDDGSDNFDRPSSPYVVTLNRNSFDSGTPRGSSASNPGESLGQLLFEAINTVPKSTEKESHEEPQYFDTDSERGSIAELRSSRGVTGSDDKFDLLDDDVRRTYLRGDEDDAPKSGGKRWGRPNLLNKLAPVAHVFDKKLSSSSSSKASSSNSNSNSNSSSNDENDEERIKPRTTALGAVAAKLARKATSSSTKTYSIEQGHPLPSNRLRKASSSASVEMDDDEGSVVYSPTAQETKSKSKFGFFRSTSAAPAVAAPAAFAKRFVWKKSADKKKKKGRSDDFDDDDYAGLSIAA